jgi:hypothetical protein
MAKRPVMIAERLGVHCASTLKLVRRHPLSRQPVDARRRCSSGDPAAVNSDLAVAEIVHQDEDDARERGLGLCRGRKLRLREPHRRARAKY